MNILSEGLTNNFPSQGLWVSVGLHLKYGELKDLKTFILYGFTLQLGVT